MGNSVWITIKLICAVVPSLWVIHLVHPVPELPVTWSMPSIVLEANMLLDLPVLVAVKALLSSCKYFFKNTISLMRDEKTNLKVELRTLQLSHQDQVKELVKKQDMEITDLRENFERRSNEIVQKFEEKMKEEREILEL